MNFHKKCWEMLGDAGPDTTRYCTILDDGRIFTNLFSLLNPPPSNPPTLQPFNASMLQCLLPCSIQPPQQGCKRSFHPTLLLWVWLDSLSSILDSISPSFQFSFLSFILFHGPSWSVAYFCRRIYDTCDAPWINKVPWVKGPIDPFRGIVRSCLRERERYTHIYIYMYTRLPCIQN